MAEERSVREAFRIATAGKFAVKNLGDTRILFIQTLFFQMLKVNKTTASTFWSFRGYRIDMEKSDGKGAL
ncbi:MAG TPA: hypothetical protein VGL71_06650 [Urbifossiella sp.]